MTQTSLSISHDTLNDLAAFSLQASIEQMNANDPMTYSFGDVVSEITAKAKRHGLDFIGYGSNRIVFDAPESPYVVKFPLETEFRSGIEQNRVETHIWDTLSDAYSSMSPITSRFFQVIDSDPDNRWVVIDRAVFSEGDDEFDGEAACTAILQTFPFLTYDCEFCVNENIGWNHKTDGYAIYDYGSHIPREFVERILGHEHIDGIGEENIA